MDLRLRRTATVQRTAVLRSWKRSRSGTERSIAWHAATRRERLVRSTLQAAWTKFGVEELDSETNEYIIGVACTVIAEAKKPKDAEEDLFHSLGPLLEAQDVDVGHFLKP
eukprot:symbB.v1.2.011498.t1/scaffold772.1/size165093/5